MADINDLASKLAFYQAGGKDPGTSTLDKANISLDTINKTIGDVLAIKKANLQNKQTVLENQKKQGELTPYKDIVAPLTPENATINENTTPEQRTAMDSLYAKRDAMGNTSLDQAKTAAEIQHLTAPSSTPENLKGAIASGYASREFVRSLMPDLPEGKDVSIGELQQRVALGKQENTFDQQKKMFDKTQADTILSPDEAIKLNVPYGTTRSQATGKVPEKTPTEGMGTTAVYANRMEQSNAIINKLENYAKTANPLAFQGQKMLPDFANKLKSDDFQSLDQAKRNFINAVLRRESGAVISPTEFEEGNKQYFPMPGDSDGVLAQKKQNRDTAIQGFIKIAGNAYTPTSLSAPQPQTPPMSNADQQALDWANANPNDPKAPAIKAKAMMRLNK